MAIVTLMGVDINKFYLFTYQFIINSCQFFFCYRLKTFQFIQQPQCLVFWHRANVVPDVSCINESFYVRAISF